MLRYLVNLLTRSRLAARVAFGGRYPRLKPGEHHFDVTTLALVRKAGQVVPRGARVLDMGTGSAAILGLWCWRHRACRVICTDIDLDLARRARANVLANGASSHVVCCESLAGLRSVFDVVLFNPPYVPTGIGEARCLPDRLRTQWDGGADGTDAIAAFLEAFDERGGDATALVGVNRRHVPRARVAPLLEGCSSKVTEIWKHPWLPVDVYVLVRKKSPSASASIPDA